MSLFRVIRLSFYALFLVAMIAAYYVYMQTVTKPLQNRELQLVVPKGVGLAWLANHLEENGVIESRIVFRAYAWMNQRGQSIKAGEYTLVDVDNIPDLIAKVEQGKVIRYAVTLIEGKRFKDYVTQLTANASLEHEVAEMSNAQIMRAVGSPGKHPEGLFAPQTYYFSKGDSDLDILKQAHERLNRVLESTWEARADEVEVNSAYELLILASIIEKETGAAEERPIISGVFNNRLRVGMKLQTDPTVIYGMGDAYNGNIRRKDLTTDTQYNTYTRFGLPPTPIAMAGEASIKAAAQPQETKAIFFVGRGDGTHQFSETLKQHNNAVIKYQLGGKPKKFSSNPEPN